MSFASAKAKAIFTADNLELGGVILDGIGSVLSGLDSRRSAGTALAVGRAEQARVRLLNAQRKLELARTRTELAVAEGDALTRANQIHARAQLAQFDAVGAATANLAQASASGLRTGGSVQTLNAAIQFRAAIVGSGLGIEGANARARAGSAREGKRSLKRYANLSDIQAQAGVEVARANAYATAATAHSRAGEQFGAGAANFLQAIILRQEQEKRKEEEAEAEGLDREAEETTSTDPLRRR